MKIIYNKLIPFSGFCCINLFGVLFARKECNPLLEVTLNHEAIHAKQMKELFYIFFYLWYVIEWFVKLFKYGKKSYYNISFEREAYKYEGYSGYLSVRSRYNWFKFI